MKIFKEHLKTEPKNYENFEGDQRFNNDMIKKKYAPNLVQNTDKF